MIHRRMENGRSSKWPGQTTRLATEIDKKPEAVQVATLLTVIGEEAREVFSTFTEWDSEGDNKKINPVLQQFEKYCQPRKNIPFERYRFNSHAQESYDHYRTGLLKLAERCDFQSITRDEILRDRLVFGIKDDQVRERLLRQSSLTLTKTDEICRAAESMAAQMKVVTDNSETLVSAVKQGDMKKGPHKPDSKQTERKYLRECRNCGRETGVRKQSTLPIGYRSPM